MFKVWLEVFLGKIGKYIIIFIEDYYYFIVPVIIIYGIFLTVSSYNLKRIEKRVNQDIVKQAKKHIKKNPEINYIDLIDKIKIPWEKFIKRYSFFPYFSQESDLWVSRVDIINVRNIIMDNHAKIRLILERSGIHLLEDRPIVRENLYTDQFHRLTKKKSE